VVLKVAAAASAMGVPSVRSASFDGVVSVTDILTRSG
jgi:hypothetical protein